MAKKRSAVSDMIKSDMSRRAIAGETGEAAPPSETQGSLWEKESARIRQEAAEKPDKKRKPVQKTPDREPEQAPEADGAAFLAFINAQAETLGLAGAENRQKLYGFLREEAMRYLRGFNAARRFYQD